MVALYRLLDGVMSYVDNQLQFRFKIAYVLSTYYMPFARSTLIQPCSDGTLIFDNIVTNYTNPILQKLLIA